MITVFPFLLVAKNFFAKSFLSWKWMIALLALTVLAFFAWDVWSGIRSDAKDKQVEVIEVLASENQHQQKVIEFVAESKQIDSEAVVTAVREREIVAQTHGEIKQQTEVKIKKIQQVTKKKVDAEPDPVKKAEIVVQADNEVASEQISSLWQSYCQASTNGSAGAVSTCLSAA